MNKTILVAPLCLVAAQWAHAQSEDALRRSFEGRTVRVKMDLPATKDGMDVYWRKDPPVDMKSYSQRIRQFGVALRAGDPVAVTTVRVKGKNIEFQLGGGGYGTAGDDTGYVPTPSALPKSNREVELERQISREPDSDYRDSLKRELARMRDRREAEDRRRRADAEALAAQKRREIEVKRLQAGSRINLWFPEGRLKEAVPTPQELMGMLGEWIDFGGGSSNAPVRQASPQYTDPPPPPPPPPSGPAASPAGGRVARGMSEAQVHQLLGQPSRRSKGRQGDLETIVETWETADERLDVTYVGGVVVKFVSSSK